MTRKVLISVLNSEPARYIARGLLEQGHEVLGFGTRENTLGALKSKPGFTFQKVDLVRHSVVRSWLYGVTDVLLIDEGDERMQRMDKLYEALIHLKSRIPRVLFLSTFGVFPEAGFYSEKFLPPQHEGMAPEAALEIMVGNYQSHMEAPAAIVRVPRMLGPKLQGDTELTGFLKSLKKLKRISLGAAASHHLQFCDWDSLVSAFDTLLKSEWRGLEKFHCVPFSRPMPEALRSLCKALNPECRIVEHESAWNRFLRQSAEKSEAWRSFLISRHWLPDYEWLRTAQLEGQDSERLFRLKEPDLKSLLKT